MGWFRTRFKCSTPPLVSARPRLLIPQRAAEAVARAWLGT